MEIELEKLKKDAAEALKNDNLELAEEMYTAILNEEPDSATALFALGTLAYQKQDYQTAHGLLSKAANLEPEAVDIVFNLAACLAAMGDRLNALRALQHATKYCQDDPVFVPRIAEMSTRLGEPAAAITLMSRLKALTPADQIVVANAQAMLGNWRDAVEMLKYLNESNPSDPAVLDKLSHAAGQLRDYDLAIKSYEDYLKLVTPTANDYLRFSDLLLIAQEAERSEHALNIAFEKGESRPEAYLLRARIERLKGDYEAVSRAVDETLLQQSNNGQAWSIKAEMATSESRPSDIQTLQAQIDDEAEISKLSSHHQALLHFALADMHDQQGDFSAASNALTKANEIQYAALSLKNTIYNAAVTEEQFSRTIASFSNQTINNNTRANSSFEETTTTPIFIVGMPRSGTTLVERILGQNELVDSGGELEAMEFVATNFWQQVGIKRLPSVDEISTQQWTELRNQYLEKLPVTTKPIITDKMPHNFRHVGLILKMFPEARIIQMHRDPRDVCLSVYQRAFPAGHNYANRWQDLQHYAAQSSRLMAHWSSMESQQILDINYEDLVANPETVGRSIVEFCGFGWQDSYLDFHQSVAQSFTFSEMQVRQPIANSRVGRWRNYEKYFPELAAFE